MLRDLGLVEELEGESSATCPVESAKWPARLREAHHAPVVRQWPFFRLLQYGSGETGHGCLSFEGAVHAGTLAPFAAAIRLLICPSMKAYRCTSVCLLGLLLATGRLLALEPASAGIQVALVTNRSQNIDKPVDPSPVPERTGVVDNPTSAPTSGQGPTYATTKTVLPLETPGFQLRVLDVPKKIVINDGDRAVTLSVPVYIYIPVDTDDDSEQRLTALMGVLDGGLLRLAGQQSMSPGALRQLRDLVSEAQDILALRTRKNAERKGPRD